MSARTFSEAIADFAVGFDLAALEPAHLHQCARALIDTVAVALPGATQPAARRAAAMRARPGPAGGAVGPARLRARRGGGALQPTWRPTSSTTTTSARR